MSRQNGYNVVVRFFIPAPKNDFKAQSAAAEMMATIVANKAVPSEFLTVAKVLDVKGAYGSMAEEEAQTLVPTPSTQAEPRPNIVPPAELANKRGPKAAA